MRPSRRRSAELGHGFSYRQAPRSTASGERHSELYCDDVPLTSLVEKYGSPFYVYSASVIWERLSAFERGFHKVPHTICYSVKANSNLHILKLLADLGCGFDVVSGGELARVLRVQHRAAKNIVFSGVGKTYVEMEEAVKAGILLFNVESESELGVLAQCAQRMKRMVSVAMRVNPDVSAKTHPYIATGLHQHKFGIPIEEARTVYARALGSKYLRVSGVSVHIGSQITDVRPFSQAMERVAKLVRELRSDGHEINYVDAGGGLGIDYEKDNVPLFPERVAAYADALLRPLRGLRVHLLLEPGRSIIGPAGALVTCVLYHKTNKKKKFLVVDAGMNDFQRPALYNAYHEIVPVLLRNQRNNKPVDVVGPVCETGDFFARGRELPTVQEHDLLAIMDAGAYGMALASNYNSRPRSPELLVDKKRVKLIRRRETIADLIRAEL
ncbi:MAG TPA: diaminopimelate decarboxylase [Terriglobales bacterium]